MRIRKFSSSGSCAGRRAALNAAHQSGKLIPSKGRERIEPLDHSSSEYRRSYDRFRGGEGQGAVV